MRDFFKKYWFPIGLLFSFSIPFFDFSGNLTSMGSHLKNNFGPDIAIILIFFCSGLTMNMDELKSGLKDFSPVLTAIFMIFIVSPMMGFLFIKSGVPFEIGAGIAIVSSMPTTLSSGVVMTAGAGGNKAQALIITIAASFISVFTIPLTLKFLVGGDSGNMNLFSPVSFMLKIGLKVLLPLIVGYIVLSILEEVKKYAKIIQNSTQIFIMIMVWMSSSSAYGSILDNGFNILSAVFFVFLFHLLLSLSSIWISKACGFGKGRRESVIFMGSQKTLPLSVVVQVSLFPDAGLTLAVCILHHLVQLVYDSFLLTHMTNSSSVMEEGV